MLTIVGNEGAIFLDASYHAVKEISFTRTVFGPLQISKLDSSGDYGHLTRDESWSSPVILFDKDGKERWSYSAGLLKGIDDSAAFESGAVVGLNGNAGIVLLDAQGKPIWQKPEGNVWHVESLDANGDGREDALGLPLFRSAPVTGY